MFQIRHLKPNRNIAVLNKISYNKLWRYKQDLKGKEEALRRHWQEIFKIQLEDNIEFDEENEEMVNQHIGQHQEVFQE